VHALDLCDQLESFVLVDLNMSEMPPESRFVRFVGWLREDGAFRLEPGWETPKITEVPRPNDAYRLELIDPNDRALVAVAPQVDSSDCQPIGGRMKSLRVLGYLPWAAGGVAVQFREGDRIIERRALAPARPDIVWESASVVDDLLRLRWRAQHSVPLTYTVGVVQGAQGIKVVDRLDASEVRIPIEGIPLQGECHAVVLATDGLRSATASSEPFVLPAKAPLVVITRPREGDVFSEREGISLLGHAIMPDGRTVSEERLRWSLDGEAVSRGRRVGWLRGVPAGVHEVELCVDDERSLASRVVVRISPPSAAESEWARFVETFADAMRVE
jgi:hypothetical protein